MAVLFSDTNQQWRLAPAWADFLIRLGFCWPSSIPGQRKIALVSMPCDSAAPALIALGALIRDLGCCNASNVRGHYDALLRYARQYLECCKDCNVRCHPELKGCGYSAEATGLLREGRKLYPISVYTDFDERLLVVNIPRGIWKIWPKRALDLHVDGDPPVRLLNPESALPGSIYQQFFEETPITSENLADSYSGLCLAGRVGGQTASREMYASIRFRFADVEFSLPDLLTVHAWSPPKTVSRMTFFNARTEQLDRHGYEPALIVADGDACFLKILGRREFDRSDIAAVVNRAINREKLEAVGNRMVGLRQWYDEHPELPGRLPQIPRGISMIVLERRDH